MSSIPDKPAFSPANPFLAKIVENRPLGQHLSGREARHIVVDLSGGGPSYECGGTLGVFARNAPEYVARLLVSQGFSGDEPVRLPRVGEALPLREALSANLHFLARPGVGFLRLATEVAGSGVERTSLAELASASGPETGEGVAYRSILEVLEAFPSVRFDAQALVSAVPVLRPRLYSISSSPLVYPAEAHLTVGVLHYNTPLGPRGGVASTFLAERVVPGVTSVPVFAARGAMRLPDDGARDVVMIASGTGIAPFRAFLQQRERMGSTGRNWLFFGNRRRDEDFYYQTEIERWREMGLLQELSLAWSREGTRKLYVQHRLLERRDALWEWITGGATLYLCGDRAGMSHGVEDALGEIAAGKGACEDTPEGRSDWLTGMRRQKRFQVDVY